MRCSYSLSILCMQCAERKPPFTGKTPRQIFKSIRSTSNRYIFPRYVPLSRSFKSFVRNLLTHRIEERMSAHRALEHRWITKRRVSMLKQTTSLPLRPLLTNSSSLSLSSTSVSTVSRSMKSRPALRPCNSVTDLSSTTKHHAQHSRSVISVGMMEAGTPLSPSPDSPIYSPQSPPIADLRRYGSDTVISVPTFLSPGKDFISHNGSRSTPMMGTFPEEPASPLAMAMEWDTSYLDEVAVEKAWALLESDDDDGDIHLD